MDSRPIRRGSGKRGHSIESKSTELFELWQLLKLMEGWVGLEAGERTGGGATVGRCSLEWREAGLHNGRRVGWSGVSRLVPMVTSSRFTAGNDCNLVQSGFMLFSICLLVLAPAEKQED